MTHLFDGTPSNPFQEIGFLLVPEFSNICFASTLEPLRATNRMADQALYRWRLYTTEGESVAASSGFRIAVDGPLTTAACPPVLFVIASFNPDHACTPRLIGILRHLSRRGTQFGGLDTGSHILARAGLLDGYKATIHWEDLTTFGEAFPNVEVLPDRYVIDRNRFTAGGGTTSLDLMLHLVRVQHGLRLALDTAGQLIYGHDMPSTDPQHSVSIQQLEISSPPLARAIELMESQIEEPVTVANIARRVDANQRDLERLFKKYLMTTPMRYYLDLRLRLAHRMLRQTKWTVAEIAVRCGFNSASALARAFRARFNLSPTAARRP
ncbi:MAG: GlxA family transcriptional regulator [Alphaproteobacteria bacterium]|nr:GlxA family transcriptional regulator [Alphaproteobacteria bacterium]